jgi:hypothetical protein
MARLTQHALFRVHYYMDKDPRPLSEQGPGGFRLGRRMTVVADEAQEAIHLVSAHEQSYQQDVVLHITEVKKEGIEVWC